MQATNAADIVQARVQAKGEQAQKAIKDILAEASEQGVNPVVLIWDKINKARPPQVQPRETFHISGEQVSKLQQYKRGAV